MALVGVAASAQPVGLWEEVIVGRDAGRAIEVLESLGYRLEKPPVEREENPTWEFSHSHTGEMIRLTQDSYAGNISMTLTTPLFKDHRQFDSVMVAGGWELKRITHSSYAMDYVKNAGDKQLSLSHFPHSLSENVMVSIGENQSVFTQAGEQILSGYDAHRLDWIESLKRQPLKLVERWLLSSGYREGESLSDSVRIFGCSSGIVEIVLNEDGTEAEWILAEIGPPDLFGEADTLRLHIFLLDNGYTPVQETNSRNKRKAKRQVFPEYYLKQLRGNFANKELEGSYIKAAIFFGYIMNENGDMVEQGYIGVASLPSEE